MCLVDTDGDPTVSDVAIPGNDDAMRAIDLIVQHIADAVEEGKRSRPAVTEAPAADNVERSGVADRPGRRPRRMSATQPAEGATDAPAAEMPAAAEAGAPIGGFGATVLAPETVAAAAT